MRNQWLAVACAAHVQRGRAGGFMQVCHGKVSPLRRIRPGDVVVYYSPTITFQGGDRLQAFTAIGIVADGDPYQVEMDGGFRPYRRDVQWRPAAKAPILPLLGDLDLTAGRRNWGYQLRFGLLPLTEHDAGLIAAAMGAVLQETAGMMAEPPLQDEPVS